MAHSMTATGCEQPARVFISVAEDSADVHAAALVRAARTHLPGCAFFGLTGPRLRDEGVETIDDLAAHAAMLTGTIGLIRRGWRALRRVEAAWDARRPDLVVLLDSPELHLPLATRARRRGLPVLYYIAPQTWASRAGRNRRIARDVDRLACILPFEEAYFRAAGVRAEYVGHPLFETLRREQADPQRVARLRSGVGATIALLPGSRRHVVQTMLPLQLRVLGALRARGVALHAAVSAASPDRAQQIRAILGGATPAVEVVEQDNASLLAAADLVLVASGTATLHVAHYRKPMVVMYDAGRVAGAAFRIAGRLVIKTPHLSLVNILARRRVVPEFMPTVRDPDAVGRVAAALLGDATWRNLMIRQIGETIRPLEQAPASENVCRIMREMLARHPG